MKKDLKEYNRKRNFNETSEPYAKKIPNKSGDYMIHLHDARRLHFDLRLGWKGVLKSWAVPKGPSFDPKIKRLAIRTEDHPDDYKSYEGVIPEKNYGAGPTLIWDAGNFIPLDDFDKGFKKGHLRFRIEGIKLKGNWSLIKLKNKEKKENWLLIKEQDEYAGLETPTDKTAPESVATGRTLDDLKEEKKISPMPQAIFPQLAVLKSTVPSSQDYFFERKYDGYRLIIFIQNKDIRLQTRNGHDWTEKFPALTRELEKLPVDNIIFDSEVVHFDKNGKTDFSELQNFMNEKAVDLKLIIFDVLYTSGTQLMELPLEQRRAFLEALFKRFKKNKNILLSESVPYSKDILKNACKKKWEGIIAKKKNASYQQKRDPSWLKIKCSNRDEFVVIGVTKPQGSRRYFGSLLIAEKNEDGLVYRGKVGTGFNEKTLKNLYEKFKQKKSNKKPPLNRLNTKDVLFWLTPYFYVEIDYSEKTTAGSLRHPVFKGLRLDKTYKKDESSDKDEIIKLSSPDKILFKDIRLTKKDLWEYYKKIMPHFLKGIKRSLLTLVRCPQGQSKACFYQKHFDQKTTHPKLVMVKEKNKKENYSYIEDENDIKALVQLGVLEFHQWSARVFQVERPLYLVFDLDPDDKLDFQAVIDAAHTIKKELETNSMDVYIRTTGGKGLHLVTPITQKMNWDEAYDFSKEIAHALAEKYDFFIATSSKAKRRNKIFIDYMRNSRGATAISNYSTRAKEGAPVATPLYWREVNSKLDLKKFNIKTVPTRLKKQKKDPWENFWKQIERMINDRPLQSE